jgi:hypothetical protein
MFCRAAVIAALLGWCQSTARAELILSEYVEGSSNNKAIEIYNNSTVAADLSLVDVQFYFNGAVTAGTTITIPQATTLAPGATYVIGDDGSSAPLLALIQQTSTSNFFNGDDAVVLRRKGVVIDSLGRIGEDPGTAWNGSIATVPTTTTVDRTLRRLSTISVGDADGGDAFDPSIQWTSSAQDDFSGLGSHAFAGVVPAAQTSDLIITGVIDGPITGGLPKAIELFVVNDIADLSVYGLGAANNGGGTDGEEFSFTGSATMGQYLYVATESTEFQNFFGFAPDFVTGSGSTAAANINGDDAIELFLNGEVVDVFGELNVDGTGQPWDYEDGWAYRLSGTGPDGNTFVLANWLFSGANALDGESTNAGAATPFPSRSFQLNSQAVPEPTTLVVWCLLGICGVVLLSRRRLTTTARR